MTLTIDGEQRDGAGRAPRSCARRWTMGTEIPKLCATDMLESFGSCRVCLVEIEGRAGTPASCTTPVAEGIVVHTQTERLARIRRGVMELYASDHPDHGADRSGERGVGDAGGGGGGRADRGALRAGREPRGGGVLRCVEPAAHGDGRVEPVFRLRSGEVHRLLPLRARLRGGAGHLRADRRGARLREPDRRRDGRGLRRLGVRVLRRLRAGLPDRLAGREGARRDRRRPSIRRSPPAPIAGSAAPSRPRCAARRWCGWCRGRTARPTAGIPASRGASPTAMPRIPSGSWRRWCGRRSPIPWRETTWEEAIGRVASEFRRIQAEHGQRRGRRDHLVALHQRGDLPGAEADPAGLRREQRRHLRAGLPLADRLRAEGDLRRERRDAGLRQRRGVRRDAGDRRQPDRRAPGVRAAG